MFAAEPAGFEAFWSQFVNYVYPATQIIYWIVMIIAVLYAVALLKRWVDSQTGGVRSGKPGANKEWEDDEEISVEEFVE